MSVGSSTSRAPIARTPKIYEIECTDADTEYSQELTASTKQLRIKNRGDAEIKVSFNENESGTLYFSIDPYATEWIGGINYNGSIYLQVNKAAQVIEILEWS